jgi:hypothetical protein
MVKIHFEDSMHFLWQYLYNIPTVDSIDEKPLSQCTRSSTAFLVIPYHLYYQIAAIAQEVSLLALVLSQATILDQANQLEQEEMLDPSICVHARSYHV